MDCDASDDLPAPPFFTELSLWQDEGPRDGAWNMAADEWLLQNVASPMLRVYRWAEPTVTFGCFQLWEEAVSLLPAGDLRPLVRRWTGGGLVEHGSDWAYSLIVPYPEPFCRVSPKISYALLHQTLAGVLRQSGGLSLFTPPPSPALIGGACFQSPVTADIVDAIGRKIAGAAQRRGKAGLLHQGSVQLAHGNSSRPTEALGKALAAALAKTVTEWAGISDAEAGQIHLQAQTCYASQSWLRKR